MLLAPKGGRQKASRDETARPVFAVAPNTGEVAPEPALVIDTLDILAFAERHARAAPTKHDK